MRHWRLVFLIGSGHQYAQAKLRAFNAKPRHLQESERPGDGCHGVGSTEVVGAQTALGPWCLVTPISEAHRLKPSRQTKAAS